MFCPIQGIIRLPQQAVCVLNGAIRKQDNTSRKPRRNLNTVEFKRLTGRQTQSFQPRLGLAGIRQQQCKLITTCSRQAGIRRDRIQPPPGQQAEHSVCRIFSQTVVEILEIIKINRHQGCRVLSSHFICKVFTNSSDDAVSVPEAGQGIGISERFQMVLIFSGLFFQGLIQPFMLYSGQLVFGPQAGHFLPH